MLILLLTRRLSQRGRTITGAVLISLGAAVFVVSAALSINLYVHGVILMAMGAILWGSVFAAKRRTIEVMARKAAR
ncbi:MAG: hypothetical protein ACRDNO_08255 [Trebonia sp.]